MKIKFFSLVLLSLFFFIKCNNNQKDSYQLYLQNCMICHSLDGSQKLGPSLNGIYGKKRELNDGSIITVDDEYLFNSILYPEKDILKGYSSSMNSFKDILSPSEINALIEFIKQY